MKVVVRGEYAFIADGREGVQVVPVAHPEAASIVATISTMGDATDAVYRNAKLCISTYGGVDVFSVRDPRNPTRRYVANGSTRTPVSC